MKNFTVTIPVSGGHMSAYLVVPEAGHGPGIVLLQEIFGVNAAMREKANKLAAHGYVVMVPDLFWRQSPNVQLNYDDVGRAEGFKLLQGFDYAKGIEDIKATFRALKSRPECRGAPAFVGFCIGGKLAVMAGAAEPSASAVVSFYGVALENNLDQLRALQMPTQLHFGDQDTHIPFEKIEAILLGVAGRNNINVYIYKGGQHGFFNHHRAEVFNDKASTVALNRTLEILPAA
jgi:carboxymethylenebutenolidase